MLPFIVPLTTVFFISRSILVTEQEYKYIRSPGARESTVNFYFENVTMGVVQRIRNRAGLAIFQRRPFLNEISKRVPRLSDETYKYIRSTRSRVSQ